MEQKLSDNFKQIHAKLTSNDELVKLINSNFESSAETKIVTFVNPYNFRLLCSSEVDISKIDYIGVDSYYLTLWLKIFGYDIARSSMDNSSLFSSVIEVTNTKNLKVLAIGGNVEAAKEAEIKLTKLFKDKNSFKVLNGYFNKQFGSNYVGQIAQAQISIISMGAILQEETCIKIKYLFPNSKLLITSGAFIEQSSIKVHYYPDLLNKLQLRWIYRFFKEPHVRKRIFLNYPKFFFWYLTMVFFYKGV